MSSGKTGLLILTYFFLSIREKNWITFNFNIKYFFFTIKNYFFILLFDIFFLFACQTFFLLFKNSVWFWNFFLLTILKMYFKRYFFFFSFYVRVSLPIIKINWTLCCLSLKIRNYWIQPHDDFILFTSQKLDE